MFDIKWTGSFPNLCHGEWDMKYGGVPMELLESIKYSDMGTYGEYYRWYFDSNMIEVFVDYSEGLPEQPWIKENMGWIKPLFDRYYIPLTPEVLHEFYWKIQAEDFRAGSCGGCI